jgi:hypothetical protein
MGQLGDDLLHVPRAEDLDVRRLGPERLLLHDRDLVGDRARVVGADLRSEPVLERRDDAAAVRVVLGVRARHHEDVEREAHQVPADLHVALFHHVEEAHLDALRQVRQLVDAEDAAVGPRNQPVVDRELVGEVPALRDLDRVDLAHEVRDGDVGRGELLAVAPVPRHPLDRGGVGLLRDPQPAGPADRRVGVVVDLAAGDGGRLRVQELDETARDPRLRLAALAQEDEVVAGEDGVLHLRDHRLLVADDAGEEGLPVTQAVDQVLAELLLHRADAVPARAELADGGGLGRDRHAPSTSSASTSMEMTTSSPTTTPLSGMAEFQLAPKSWRSIRVVAVNPARVSPNGDGPQPR